MKSKLIALAVLGFVFAIVGTVKIASTNRQEQLAALYGAKDRWTLNWVARLAKAKGQQKISIPAPDVDYGEARNLDEALAHYSVIVAEPVDERTYAREARNIVTWYKFRIIEVLSQSDSSCSGCPPIDPPEELLPLSSNEILASKYGGTLIIDGVQVSMTDAEFPNFEKGQEYLLLASITPSGFARIAPSRVFRLSEDGLLEPVNEKSHPVKREIETRFGSSLTKFREYSRFRKQSTN